MNTTGSIDYIYIFLVVSLVDGYYWINWLHISIFSSESSSWINILSNGSSRLILYTGLMDYIFI